MSWMVYMVECSDGSLYTGITNDIQKRLSQHNSGMGAKYTRARRPVTLKASWVVQSKGEALRMEYRLKRLKRAHKLRLVGQ